MNFEYLRKKMVEEQIVRRGIHNPKVIEAMRKVWRHEFIPEEELSNAYADCPLSIGEGQTISQPFMVAIMTQSLKIHKADVVLEIGTGSGYQTAILAELAKEVYTIEKIEALSLRAQKILNKLHYSNIHFCTGDGSLGWQEKLNFEAIMVTAAAPAPLENLFEQLGDQGRLLIPIGDRLNQVLMLYTKKQKEIKEERICGCVFVPLIGQYGWHAN